MADRIAELIETREQRPLSAADLARALDLQLLDQLKADSDHAAEAIDRVKAADAEITA